MLQYATVLLALLLQLATAAPEYYRYIVLGAGPGGLQIAHYLHSAGRHYAVLDAAAGPGSFFATYPRWRQLISINKRATGREELDFNMRHDWNSLLSEPSHSARRGTAVGNYSSTAPGARLADVPPQLLFRNYSNEYYPHADALVAYLLSWQKEMGLHVQHGVRIRSIGRPSSAPQAAERPADKGAEAEMTQEAADLTAGTPRFELQSEDGRTFTCTVLVFAGGLQQMVPPVGANMQQALAEGTVMTYSSAPADLELYVNKHVLILGRGNAAMEWANNLLEVAASVQVLGRNRGRIKLAWETHYPGDVRSIHSHVLESYQLKSMDGLAEVAHEHLQFERTPAGKVRVTDVHAQCKRDEWGRTVGRCFFQKEYDYVISCSGWMTDRSVFAADMQPQLAANGKHPALTARYSSPNIPGLYFAGTLAHAHDFKKSSGGFIHGFRYTARALHRILEEAEWAAGQLHGGSVSQLPAPAPSPWPRTVIRGLRHLTEALLQRANVAAGPYQMFGSLVDVVVLAPVHSPKNVSQLAAAVRFCPLAALQQPWSHPPPTDANIQFRWIPYIPGDCRAAAGEDSLACEWLETQEDEAVQGWLLEEVPVLLVPSMVRTWLQQTYDSSYSGPVEYMTLSLEFGSGPAEPRAAAGAKGAASAAAAQNTESAEWKQRGEWKKDPFSRFRANVNLREPEASTFLHPVVRYYNTATAISPAAAAAAAGSAGGAPLHRCDVIEDFNSLWSDHTAHVLPLARCLQYIAGRRLQAAAMPAVQVEVDSATVSSAAPSDTSSVAAVLRSVWAPIPRPPSTHASLLEYLASFPDAMLAYGGELVPGGDGFWLSLRVEAEAALLYPSPGRVGAGSGVRFFAIHAYDPVAPGVPLSAEERSFTDSVSAENARLSRGMAGLFEARTHAPHPPAPPTGVPSSASPSLIIASNTTAVQAHYAALTAAHAGLAVVLLPCRSGRCLDRLQAVGISHSALPALRVVDDWSTLIPSPSGLPVGRALGSVGELATGGADLAVAAAALADAWAAAPSRAMRR